MNHRRALFVVIGILLVGLGLAWGAREYRQHVLMQRALRDAPAVLRELTKDLPEVRFERTEGNRLYYSSLERVERNGEIFVEYVPHEAIIRFRGVGRATPPSIDYQDLERGQRLWLVMEPNPEDLDLPYVNAAYIAD